MHFRLELIQHKRESDIALVAKLCPHAKRIVCWYDASQQVSHVSLFFANYLDTGVNWGDACRHIFRSFNNYAPLWLVYFVANLCFRD